MLWTIECINRDPMAWDFNTLHGDQEKIRQNEVNTYTVII
jgi:hypothetical protein